MQPKKILLFPFGGNAREALPAIMDANRVEHLWDPVGFIDDEPTTHGLECCGIKVIGGRDILREMLETEVLAVPGNPSGFSRRRNIIEGLGLNPLKFAKVIHPSVTLAQDSVIGFNTLIMSNVVISCGVKIGNHCIILPNTVISHDSTVDDYCCIGSNVSISGGVHLGENCYVGSGAKVKENCKIGAGTLIGIGAIVICEVDAGVIAVGNPARVIKTTVPQFAL